MLSLNSLRQDCADLGSGVIRAFRLVLVRDKHCLRRGCLERSVAVVCNRDADLMLIRIEGPALEALLPGGIILLRLHFLNDIFVRSGLRVLQFAEVDDLFTGHAEGRFSLRLVLGDVSASGRAIGAGCGGVIREHHRCSVFRLECELKGLVCPGCAEGFDLLLHDCPFLSGSIVIAFRLVLIDDLRHRFLRRCGQCTIAVILDLDRDSLRLIVADPAFTALRGLLDRIGICTGLRVLQDTEVHDLGLCIAEGRLSLNRVRVGLSCIGNSREFKLEDLRSPFRSFRNDCLPQNCPGLGSGVILAFRLILVDKRLDFRSSSQRTVAIVLDRDGDCNFLARRIAGPLLRGEVRDLFDGVLIGPGAGIRDPSEVDRLRICLCKVFGVSVFLYPASVRRERGGPGRIIQIRCRSRSDPEGKPLLCPLSSLGIDGLQHTRYCQRIPHSGRLIDIGEHHRCRDRRRQRPVAVDRDLDRDKLLGRIVIRPAVVLRGGLDLLDVVVISPLGKFRFRVGDDTEIDIDLSGFVESRRRFRNFLGGIIPVLAKGRAVHAFNREGKALPVRLRPFGALRFDHLFGDHFIQGVQRTTRLIFVDNRRLLDDHGKGPIPVVRGHDCHCLRIIVTSPAAAALGRLGDSIFKCSGLIEGDRTEIDLLGPGLAEGCGAFCDLSPVLIGLRGISDRGDRELKGLRCPLGTGRVDRLVQEAFPGDKCALRDVLVRDFDGIRCFHLHRTVTVVRDFDLDLSPGNLGRIESPARDAIFPGIIRSCRDHLFQRILVGSGLREGDRSEIDGLGIRSGEGEGRFCYIVPPLILAVRGSPIVTSVSIICHAGRDLELELLGCPLCSLRIDCLL